MGRKRLYDLTYEATGKPVWLEDAGHLLKISGILMQGQGSSLLLLSPTADWDSLWDGGMEEIDALNLEIEQPSLELWCEIIRQTDDPQIFEEDETGTIKAVHRKQQFAISGAVQQKIWARDGFRCMYCGKGMGDVQLTVDHFIPLELGGHNNDDNYISACRRCGKKKGSQNPKEFCENLGYDYEGLCLYLTGNAPASFIAHLT